MCLASCIDHRFCVFGNGGEDDRWRPARRTHESALSELAFNGLPNPAFVVLAVGYRLELIHIGMLALR